MTGLDELCRDWKEPVDAGHPLNRAERDVQLLTTAGLSDAEINHILGDE